jgi:hypothetical protein
MVRDNGIKCQVGFGTVAKMWFTPARYAALPCAGLSYFSYPWGGIPWKEDFFSNRGRTRWCQVNGETVDCAIVISTILEETTPERRLAIRARRITFGQK